MENLSTNNPDETLQLPVDMYEDSNELSREQKDTAITELIAAEFDGGGPDVLIPLSGGIRESPMVDIGYRSLSWSDVGEHGTSTGGRTRIIAAAEIAKVIPDLPVVTNSFNRFDATEPSMASISKAELIRRGVDPERVMLEESSFSTITQLTEMVKLALENDWSKIAIVVNEYYLPRITELYNRLDSIVDDDDFQDLLTSFKAQDRRVAFIAAEPVMRIMNSRYGRYFEEVEQSPTYKMTVAAEAQGLKDLKEGKYRVVLHPEQNRDA